MAYDESRRSAQRERERANPTSASDASRRSANDIKMGKNSGMVRSGFKIVLTVIVSIIMVAAVVLSYTQDLEASRDLEEVLQKKTDMQSDILDMRSEIAGKTSNKIIQEYAENILGMRTIDPSQVEYVQIQTDDVVNIPEEEQNIFARMKAWFDNFVEYLRG